LFLFFFSFHSSPNKQKTELQSESNPATSWIPSPWKASLHHTKWHHFSLTADSKLACMKLQKIQVSIAHHMWLPYLPPHPGKIIQRSHWVVEPLSLEQNWKS
jgi:hypothetical protein